MGRGIIESGLFRSEQFGVEQRTSDPADHQEGERWIRTDLAPEADQIATYRFDMGTEVVDIPIYDANASVDGVEKVRRVQVGGQTGFIPFTSSSPTYPEWAMQHNGSRLGAHDALTASTIPDSAVLHWPHDEGSSTTLTETLNTYGEQDGTINGATWTADSAWWEGQYLDYDGADDYTLTGTWGDFGANVIDSAFTLILEVRWPSGDDGYTIGVANSDSSHLFAVGTRSFITGDQQGQIGFRYRNNGNNAVFATDPTFDDGSRHFVAIQMSSGDPSTGQIYVDNGFVTTNVNQTNTVTGNEFPVGVAFGAINSAGSLESFSTADLGRIMATDAILTESELDDIAQKHGFGP